MPRSRLPLSGPRPCGRPAVDARGTRACAPLRNALRFVRSVQSHRRPPAFFGNLHQDRHKLAPGDRLGPARQPEPGVGWHITLDLIPPLMFGSPSRGSHVPVSDPRPSRSVTVYCKPDRMKVAQLRSCRRVEIYPPPPFLGSDEIDSIHSKGIKDRAATQAQALISSNTRRNGGAGERHMVRYVSRKGSQASPTIRSDARRRRSRRCFSLRPGSARTRSSLRGICRRRRRRGCLSGWWRVRRRRRGVGARRARHV